MNERKIHLHGLSDEQIKTYFNDENRFGGVFSNDELPIPQKNKCYIINLENHNEGGSHWVALFNGYYFDSYGEISTLAIAPHVKKYNTNDYQGLNQESCGYFAMYACCNFMKHKDPADGLIPNKFNYNESVLKNFFF